MAISIATGEHRLIIRRPGGEPLYIEPHTSAEVETDDPDELVVEIDGGAGLIEAD